VPAKETKRRRYVDMWALPGMHPSNLELLQELKTADTNQFTTHMDCVGTVSEYDFDERKWEKSHLVGIRTDVWKPNKQELGGALTALQKERRKVIKEKIKRSGRLSSQQKRKLETKVSQDEVMQLECDDIVSRRLVMKLFKSSSKRLRWVGTIEQVTTSEVHNSIGSNRMLLSLAVMLPGTQLVTHIQQNNRPFRIPSIFSGCYYDEGRMWNLMLRRKWVSIGADFEVHADDQAIGKIDGKLLSFGCDSYVHVNDHPLSKDTGFIDLLTLFTCSIGYHRAMRRSVRKRVKAAAAGESYRHVIEDEELRLRHNGRSAA